MITPPAVGLDPPTKQARSAQLPPQNTSRPAGLSGVGFLPGPPRTLAAKSPTSLMVPRPPTAELGLKLGQLPVHLPTKSPKCFTRENDRSIDQPIRPPRRPTPQFLHSSQSSQRRTKPRCKKPSDQAFFAPKPPGAMPFSIGYRRKRRVVPRIYAIPLL